MYVTELSKTERIAKLHDTKVILKPKNNMLEKYSDYGVSRIQKETKQHSNFSRIDETIRTPYKYMNTWRTLLK